MKRISFDVYFTVGQEVFRKCDADKNRYYVTNYVVDGKDVLYTISGCEGRFILYHFEIADYGERLAILN
jgi:hypothetical protein